MKIKQKVERRDKLLELRIKDEFENKIEWPKLILIRPTVKKLYHPIVHYNMLLNGYST